MTNKQGKFSQDQPFSAHPPAPLGTPLTQIVLPLCGGVAEEAIAPHPSDASTSPNNLDLSNSVAPSNPSRTCEQVMGNLCEVAIALLIFGTILGWLTTVPLWLPQFFPKPYSATPWCVRLYSDSYSSPHIC